MTAKFKNMKATIEINNQSFVVDLSKPIDISLPLNTGVNTVSAFYIPPVVIEPIRIGNFVGSVNEGGACNVNNITFNPHGNGTHTECVGHISKEDYFIRDSLTQYFFKALLVSIEPEKEENGDLVITQKQIESVVKGAYDFKALIIRTLPNTEAKETKNYSGTNPAYLHHEAAKYIRKLGIEHLLLDLPSVDREDDGGKLSAHHEFWNYPSAPRLNATITELIYVESSIPDGDYLLNLQFIGIENDASPSRPLLFKLLQN
jgi:arylformamidase